jgi:hypothetical protein
LVELEGDPSPRRGEILNNISRTILKTALAALAFVMTGQVVVSALAWRVTRAAA